MKNNFINNIFSLIYKMKTTSLKKLLNHNFFIYGMVFISVLQLLNFYNAYSLLCLGTFGITYYVACMATKNKGVCLLAANIVSIFILGCEKSGVLEGFKEGNENQGDAAANNAAANNTAANNAAADNAAANNAAADNTANNSMEARLKVLEDFMKAHGAGTDAVAKPHKKEEAAAQQAAQ